MVVGELKCYSATTSGPYPMTQTIMNSVDINQNVKDNILSLGANQLRTK